MRRKCERRNGSGAVAVAKGKRKKQKQLILEDQHARRFDEFDQRLEGSARRSQPKLPILRNQRPLARELGAIDRKKFKTEPDF